ncbi:MAG: hypothetical protein WC796_03665 [Candidatus Pacearchaeota archaeon]
MENKRRVRLDIPDNSLYSQMLFSIIAGNNYPQKIAEVIGKEPSNVSRQVQLLKRKGYVNSKKYGNKNKFPFEKTIYEVKWEKIIELFLDRIKFKIELNRKASKSAVSPTLSKEIMPNILEIEGLYGTRDFVDSIKSNKYLIKYFELLFSELHKIDKTRTLNDVFDYIIVFGLFDCKEVINDNKSVKDLERLSFLINFGAKNPSLRLSTEIAKREFKAILNRGFDAKSE